MKKTEKIIDVIYLILVVITFVFALWETRDLSLGERISTIIVYTLSAAFGIGMFFLALSEIKDDEIKKTEKILYVIYFILVVITFVRALWETRDLSLGERIFEIIVSTSMYSFLFGLGILFLSVLSEMFSDFKKMIKSKKIKKDLMLIPHRKGDKWGYIDKQGKIVIPIQYDKAGFFSEGLAPVKFNSKWGFIDTKGNMVIPPVYDKADIFSEGLAQVKINGKYGFIDTKGKMVIPAVYDLALNFSEGLVGVEINGKWGYIDKKGRMVIPPVYDDVQPFSDNGHAMVEVNGKYGYIDTKGDIVRPLV